MCNLVRDRIVEDQGCLPVALAAGVGAVPQGIVFECRVRACKPMLCYQA
jgi:hypothetical protein